LVFGAAASYALNLIHNPLPSLTSRFVAMIGMGWFGALIASAVMCVVAEAVENPGLTAVEGGP